MEILQLHALALQERIEQEMNDNPLLEQQEIDPLAPEEATHEGPTKDTRSENEKEHIRLKRRHRTRMKAGKKDGTTKY